MQIKRTPEEVLDLLNRVPGALRDGLKVSKSPDESMIKTLMAASIVATSAWFSGGETEIFLNLLRDPLDD